MCIISFLVSVKLRSASLSGVIDLQEKRSSRVFDKILRKPGSGSRLVEGLSKCFGGKLHKIHKYE